MCRLYKSLYGHPESGAHWEQHLTERLKLAGGVPIQNHPSSFWFADTKMMLSVYVDDLLLSGPSENHAAIWTLIRGHGVEIEDPEPLSRFLGRYHRRFEYNL